jgi:hypothetical protein
MEALPRTCTLVFLLLLQLLLVVAPWQGGVAARALNFTRADFPRDFVFGSGTSSYQVHHVHAYQSTTHAYGEALGVFPSTVFFRAGFQLLSFDLYAVRRCDRCRWKESKHLGHFHSCRYSPNILPFHILSPSSSKIN